MEDIRKGNCPLCGHHEIIVAHPIALTSVTQPVRQLAVIDLVEKKNILGMTVEGAPAAAGKLDTYTCRACGYTQWFVRDPQQIPLGLLRVIEGVPRSVGPYR